jgi:gamma-glutamylcyclotransferase (GGCT)/AIG2-like uncharacterized protein YtfP
MSLDPDKLLFAYGTLMSGDTGLKGRPQRDRLARECRVVGAASLEGELYNLGQYPALLIDTGTPGLVHGELVELADPAKSFRWLDAYEGIVPSQHTSNEYERVQRTVTLADGNEITAWVYVWRAPLRPGSTHIPRGRWLER